jgi:CRP-like cAMP-binding protein
MKALYPFIEDFSESRERLFMDSLMYRVYHKGHTLAEEGISCNTIHFLIKGSIRIFKVSEDCREITSCRYIQGTGGEETEAMVEPLVKN